MTENLNTDFSHLLFSKAPQTILDFSDEGLASLPHYYLAEMVKGLGDYQDYCYKMADLAEAAMVRVESMMTNVLNKTVDKEARP